MRKLYSFITILALSAISKVSYGQCGVKATASSININCGDSVRLNAIPNGCKPLNNDFNAGTTGPWAATPGGIVVANSDPAYSCMTVSPDGPFYFFMGSNANTPRSVESNGLNLNSCPNVGGSACWFMKYSSQGQTGTCEGPDATGEGVYLEYSTNNGTSWIQLAYYDPNGGNDPQLTSWNQYCVALPNAAITGNTKFRWIQKASSGAGFDTWAIDNVQIIMNIPGYTFDWLHDSQGPAATPSTPRVAPPTTTTYTVNYSNTATGGSDACTSTITVNVATPNVSAITDKASICPGQTANLQAISSYKALPPSTCGASSSNTCNSVTSQSAEYTLPTGNSVNTSGNCNENIFGVSNCGGGLRSQLLYTAAELTAAGVKAGKITYLTFEIAQVAGGNTVIKGGVTYARYQNLRVKMGCTNATALQGFGGSGYTPGANTTVYNAKQTDLCVGWNTFVFDTYYDWDGTSNILVDLCYALPSGENQVYTRNVATSFLSTCTDGTNGAGGSSFDCNAASSFVKGYSLRVNTKFGTCEPKTNVVLNYAWSPSGTLSSSTIDKPVATPGSTTTYTVSVSPPGNPACLSTANVAVTVVDLQPAISPQNQTYCPPGAGVSLTASGNPTGTFNGPITFSSTNAPLTVANNNTTGVSSTIGVTGITPTTLATNPVAKVCLNTTTAVGDLRVNLTSPAGNTVTLYNRDVTGNGFTNTCFVTGQPLITTGAAPYTGNFGPLNAFPTAGNVNGNWTLNVADIANPALGNVNGATFSNWNITFNTNTNGVINYQWINTTTGLSTTTNSNTVATPSVTTTYTVKLTDALGCTATQTVVVGYCATVPIELLSFNGSHLNNSNLLRWETATESNSSHFVIERSEDGIRFAEIGRSNAAGESTSIKQYEYQDLNLDPTVQTYYYKLKLVDQDGTFKYSSVLSLTNIQNNPNILTKVSPIPTKDYLYLSLSSGKNDESIKLEILDFSGKVIRTESLNLKMGVNELSLDVNDLIQGIYNLKITGNSIMESRKFIKN